MKIKKDDHLDIFLTKGRNGRNEWNGWILANKIDERNQSYEFN